MVLRDRTLVVENVLTKGWEGKESSIFEDPSSRESLKSLEGTHLKFTGLEYELPDAPLQSLVVLSSLALDNPSTQHFLHLGAY